MRMCNANTRYEAVPASSKNICDVGDLYGDEGHNAANVES